VPGFPNVVKSRISEEPDATYSCSNGKLSKSHFRVEKLVVSNHYHLLHEKFCPIYFVLVLLPNVISSFVGKFIKRYVLL